MKAVILAGGTGSRLFPVTRAVNKHLLPVYNKPLIYFPIETVKALGATEVLLITNPADIPAFKALLGVGVELGLSIDYAAQAEPAGIAQGALIAEQWLAGESFYLALGDNVFTGFKAKAANGATAYATRYHEDDIRRFGVFNPKTMLIEEKPAIPASDLVAVGLYHLPADAPSRVKSQKPSKRGELEITDLLNSYCTALNIEEIEGGWHDCGTFDSLLQTSIEMRNSYRQAEAIGQQ